MAGVTKEEIALAKELDLLTYFKLVEPGNLKLVGKEYRHKVHSSLTISKDSLWCWHCIGLRGRTALKYLIDVEKVPYVEAVREINRIQGGVVHSSQPVSLPQPRAETEAPRDFKLPKPDANSYAAMAYLRGRCIHPNVLAFCRREGILYQTSFKNHPNCVFVGRDGEGVAKGGSLRGCTQLQFRRDIPGSKKIYPFYIQASTKADTVEVYEAPIDAMSGASLKLMQHTGPWRSVHYLALGGTDYAALDAFLKYFPAVCKIVLCLDNDNAGRTRTQDIIAHLAGSGKAVEDRPPPVIRQVVLADDLQGLRLKDRSVNALAQILELIRVQTGQTGGGQQIRQVVVLGHQGELGQLILVGDNHDVNGVAGLVSPLVQGGSECIALAGLLRQHDLQGLAAGRSGAGSCGVRCCSGAGRRCSGRTAAGCQRSRHRGCQSQRKCFFHVGFTSCKVEIKIGYIHRALTRFAPFRGLGTGLSVPLVYP